MIQNNRYYWSHLKTKTVTVRVQPKAKALALVFRVSSVIDVGNGRQTVVLDHVDFPASYRHRARAQKNDLAIPFKMGNLDFVYTSRGNPSVDNVQNLLEGLYQQAQIEKIVPEVVCPGDLLVFRQEGAGMKISMVEALRVVKDTGYKTKRAEHAL
ncbi:MAG: hypothetical protein KDI13_00440 [Alphaproteobacteria bacterium]|nr:hypothetical protein [Alphaproteobacteria bacterium]